MLLLRCELTNKNDVEVQESIDGVEVPWLSAVQVWTVRGEQVVLDDVEGGQRQLAVVLTVSDDERGQDGQE